MNEVISFFDAAATNFLVFFGLYIIGYGIFLTMFKVQKPPSKGLFVTPLFVSIVMASPLFLIKIISELIRPYSFQLYSVSLWIIIAVYGGGAYLYLRRTKK